MKEMEKSNLARLPPESLLSPASARPDYQFEAASDSPESLYVRVRGRDPEETGRGYDELCGFAANELGQLPKRGTIGYADLNAAENRTILTGRSSRRKWGCCCRGRRRNGLVFWSAPLVPDKALRKVISLIAPAPVFLRTAL